MKKTVSSLISESRAREMQKRANAAARKWKPQLQIVCEPLPGLPKEKRAFVNAARSAQQTADPDYLPILFLIRKKPRNGDRQVAHLWDGRDTICRMYSTGGMRKKKYRVGHTDEQREICRMCANNAKNLPTKVQFERLSQIKMQLGEG